MLRYFYELEVESLMDKTIVLDIDGTITYDGSHDIHTDSATVVKKLAMHNKIFLCSNKNQNRVSKFARTLGVNPLISAYRKPNKRTLKSLAGIRQDSLVVIGDKWLTDGLLARGVNARFIKVRRLINQRESFLVKLTNALDNFVYKIWNFLKIKSRQ